MTEKHSDARPPAIGLIIAGILSGLFALWGFFYSPPMDGLSGEANAAIRALMKVMGIVGIVGSAFQIYGGIQALNHTNRALAKTSAILAICSVLWSGIAGLLVGLPIGIWALIVLSKPDVKSVFAK